MHAKACKARGVWGHAPPVANLEFWKGGFLYAIKACVACLLGGSGGMPPRKILDF